METFKRYDLWISVILITGSALYSLIKADFSFIVCYFIVGGWQVISMVVHATNGWFISHKSRKFYHWIVAVIIAVGLLAFLMPYLLFIYYIMLFVAPLMAIYYTVICNIEVKELRKNHSLALK